MHDPDDPPFSTLPDVEIQLLINTVTTAVDLVADGRTTAGYFELRYGLQRARAIGEDEPWGAALVEHYRRSLDQFTRAYVGVERSRPWRFPDC